MVREMLSSRQGHEAFVAIYKDFSDQQKQSIKDVLSTVEDVTDFDEVDDFFSTSPNTNELYATLAAKME